MGRSLPQWEQRVRGMLGNPSTDQLASNDLQDEVEAAVRQFSADSPQVALSDFTGNGTAFDLTLPPAWQAGFSSVRAVEYPQGERPPSFLDLAEVQPHPFDSAPTVIRLMQTIPANGKTARIYFTKAWPVPDAASGTDLISEADFEPVCHLAAWGGALELAGRAAGNKSPSLPSAAVVDFQTEEQRWRDIARDHLKAYQSHVGGADGPAPADAITDWDALSTWADTGRTFLFRPRRR